MDKMWLIRLMIGPFDCDIDHDVTYIVKAATEEEAMSKIVYDHEEFPNYSCNLIDFDDQGVMSF